MGEVRDRVTARLSAAQGTSGAAALRLPEAAQDALALLREVTADPAGAVDLAAVNLVFWTFCLRHTGPADPDAARNTAVMSFAFGFLYPRAPASAVFPEPFKAAFDPADPLHDARFALLVADTHGEFALAPDTAEDIRRAALDRALAWSGLARSLLPPEHASDPVAQVQAFRFEAARFELAADPDALARAAGHGRVVCEALTAEARGGPLPPDGASVLSAALGVVADAARMLGEPAIEEAERLIAAAPPGTLPPAAVQALRDVRELRARATAWPGQFDLLMGIALANGGAADDDHGRVACAVRRLRAALAATPAGHPQRGAVAGVLAEALETLARVHGDAAAAREAAELRAREPGAQGGAQGGDLSPEEALAFVRDAYERSDGPPVITMELLSVAASPDGQPATDERIERFRAALAQVVPEHPRRYAYDAVLASLLGLRAGQLHPSDPGRAARLDAEARTLGREAAAAAPPGVPLVAALASGRYELALPYAAAMALLAAPDGSFDDPELAASAALLSRITDLSDRTERSPGDPDALAEGVAVMRDLLAGLPEGDSPDRAELSAALGTALYAHSAASRDLAAADEIVALLRYAREHSPERDPAADEALARTLTLISTLRFDPAAAREAAAVRAEAAARGAGAVGTDGAGDAPADVESAAMAAISELHSALQNYILGHEPAQLEQARQAALRLKELGARAGDDPAAARLGLDLAGDTYLNLLDGVGPGGGPRGSVTDDQLERCRAAFEACPPGHRYRLNAAMTYTRMLAHRAMIVRRQDPAGVTPLLDEARRVIDLVAPEAPEALTEGLRSFITMAGAGPEEFPRLLDAAAERGPLAIFSAERFPSVLADFLGPSAGIDTASFPGVPTMPAWLGAHEAIGAAAGAIRRSREQGGGIDAALDHIETAVELLPRITDRGSDQQSAEHALISFDGDLRGVTDLVLMTITLERAPRRFLELLRDPGRVPGQWSGAGQRNPMVETGLGVIDGPEVDRAVELLERGRGLLLARRIEARVDVSELRAAHPEAAEAFEWITDELARPHPEVLPEQARLDALHASRALDDLIGRIRRLPGFEGFLRPLTAERLRRLAADGPVVLLQQGPGHCHAIVVTGERITALLLAPETPEVTERARQLREAVDAINARGGARPSPPALVRASATVRGCLSWTWHDIVRPVLDHLGIAGAPPEGGAWPRIWWVPTGVFNALPLHAAQCAPESADCESGGRGCGAALDAVVSSYVPGFQTLAYARARAGARAGGAGGAAGNADAGNTDAGYASALLVAVPEDEVPGVAAAARYAAGLLGAPEPLVGAAATRTAVLGALGEARWAHFGCHAATDPDEPSGARLHLPSGEQLSVLEICRARPDAARLAFLTACGTARSSERLSDEAIHITGAFLLAGFPEVVGTLWEIDGEHAEQVTRAFYRRVTAGDGGPSASALALHHTVRELRRRLPGRPQLWAAYVHAGA
ncbi:CHAT domain-containing protein [Kitasatospora sp. NPDC015120]|uniref:CHAT domain-containing protein n=1 Tax=Kitasatospora sp. NPDC015120 TaxID=3364023 RepID=UPI0036F467C2